MTGGLPADNPHRREVEPLMRLIAEASRIRAFNRTLGTHETSLDGFDPLFVQAVIAWSEQLKD